MATDTYVNAAYQTGALDPYPSASKNSGAELNGFCVVFEFAGAQVNGDVLRVVKDIPADAILFDADISCDALTGMTDVDFGIFTRELGAAKDADVFVDGKTFATALRKFQAQAAMDIDKFGKKMWELAGDTEDNHPTSYDLGLLLNTAGSASGTCVVRGSWIQG